jgi:type IV secretion system protein VirD4
MTERELRKARLHRRKKGARLIGSVHGSALWLWTEVHHLIVGPAGSSKTSAAITNILMGSSESALITDIKGELWMITRDHRAKAFGHDVVKVDPKDPENSIKINPLDDIAIEVANDDPAAFSRTRGIVLQLLPSPKGGAGANEVFNLGARNLVVTVILAVVIILPTEHRNLAMVYRALSDLDVLHTLLDAASKSKALNGEIADMARSTHASAFGDDGSGKTFESFRINATIGLEAFGPGNYLAALTSTSTFHFRELKERKVSVYILLDYANAEVLGAFSGLLQHLAADAMVAEGTSKKVLFCLDEFTNAPMQKIAKVLTLLRSAGVRVVLATQDLNDIERVYSKEDLETILSETEIKQFLGGIRAKKTLEWLSSYLGEYTETVSSYAMGREGPQESLSRFNRKLFTEDELRRLPDDAQIVLYGRHKPILAKKVQVFSIAPWRHALGINTGYGTKRLLKPVEMRLRWWGTEVRPRARRAYMRMEKELFAKRGHKSRLWWQILRTFGVAPLLAIGIITAVAVYGPGLPNLRVQYTYAGSAQQTPRTYLACRYVGFTSPSILRGPRCPLILWRKP